MSGRLNGVSIPTFAGLPPVAHPWDANPWGRGSCFRCFTRDLPVLFVGTIHVPGAATQAFACARCIESMAEWVWNRQEAAYA